METELIRIAAMGIVAAVLALVISDKRPEFGMLVGLAFAVIALWLILGKAGAVLRLIEETVKSSGIDTALLMPVLKVTGMAYITQFSVDACRDAGQNGIASKVEAAGKIMMLVVAVPIVTSLIRIISTIL